MPQHDSNTTGVPFEPEDATEQALWAQLAELPREVPPPHVRRRFHARLERHQQRWNWLLQLRPALPAMAALLVGVLIGLGFDGRDTDPRIDQLQQQLTALNQTVALALLDDGSASERLRGVTLAAGLQDSSPALATALLHTAGADRSATVRNAAIEALGPRLGDPRVAAELQRLLLDTPSVLVQTTIAEVILRFGSDVQIQQLIDAAEAGELDADVQRYVAERVRRVTA